MVYLEISSPTSMCVVPVILRHPEAESVVFTYALLDPCCQGTFVDDNLVKSLNIEGDRTKLIL